MKYSSKIDLWVLVVLVLIPAWLLVDAIVLRSLLVALLAASVLVVYALVVFPTNYELSPEVLKVRSGVIHTSIPYQEIS